MLKYLVVFLIATPAFAETCQGFIHSVQKKTVSDPRLFASVVNHARQVCAVQSAQERADQKCSTNFPCGDLEVCVKGQCVTQGAGDGSSTCTSDEDCAFPTVSCVGGQCVR
jgi:hypothetical protein